MTTETRSAYGYVLELGNDTVTATYHYSDHTHAEPVTMAMPGPFHSIEHLARENESAGGFFFSPGANRFFGARYLDLIGGRILISSVKHPVDRRVYKATVFTDNARDGFDLSDGYFSTAAQARKAAYGICDLAASDVLTVRDWRKP